VAAFYEFHQRHGVDLGDLLTAWQRRGRSGASWRPLLAHSAAPGWPLYSRSRPDLVLAATAKVRKPTCNLTHPSAATSSLIVS